MAKQKKVTFVINQGAKGFYFSILAANGKNLNPADPQKKKQSVVRAINSLCGHLEAGQWDVTDVTKPVKAKKK